jgi:hypothetical protein
MHLLYSRQGRAQQPESYVLSFANTWHTSRSLSRSRLLLNCPRLLPARSRNMYCVVVKQRLPHSKLLRGTCVLPISSFLKERAVMSLQQRFIYLPLVGTVLLCLLVGLSLAAWKRFSKSTPSNKITKHTVETPPDEALKYWTADRMRNAKAAPLPKVNSVDREKQDPRPPRPQDA